MASRDINDLSPEVRGKAERALELAKVSGLELSIYCTYRSDKEQAQLFRKGRTLDQIQAKAAELRDKWGRQDLADLLIEVGPQFGGKVTNAGPGQSAHNYRLAFDAVPLVGGKPVWNGSDPIWDAFGKIIREAGLEWGGDWTGLIDKPHSQLKGFKWQDHIGMKNAAVSIPAPGADKQTGQVPGADKEREALPQPSIEPSAERGPELVRPPSPEPDGQDGPETGRLATSAAQAPGRLEVVYVAGPYRSKDGMHGVKRNIDAALQVAHDLWRLGFVAICPHGNSYMMDGPDIPAERFLKGDLEILRRVDSVCLIPGWETSEGARGEAALALQLGKPFWRPTGGPPYGFVPMIPESIRAVLNQSI